MANNMQRNAVHTDESHEDLSIVPAEWLINERADEDRTQVADGSMERWAHRQSRQHREQMSSR